MAVDPQGSPGSPTGGPPGRDPRAWRIESAAAIRAFFAGRGKQVVYFAGYGELGYEEEGCVRRVATGILAGRPAAGLLVLGGTLLRAGGNDGIAEIYAVAKGLGVVTAGVHPSVAMQFADTHRVSPHCDHVFFVDDATWGGFLEGTSRPSPTLQLHLAIADEAVFIGGGKHAADELRAFAAAGKPVRYVPADMNHAATREWCRRDGADIRDFRGAAHAAWEEIQRSAAGCSQSVN